MPNPNTDTRLEETTATRTPSDSMTSSRKSDGPATPTPTSNPASEGPEIGSSQTSQGIQVQENLIGSSVSSSSSSDVPESGSGRGRRASQLGSLTRSGLGMAPRRESDQLDTHHATEVNRASISATSSSEFPARGQRQVSIPSSSSYGHGYGSIHKSSLRRSFGTNTSSSSSLRFGPQAGLPSSSSSSSSTSSSGFSFGASPAPVPGSGSISAPGLSSDLRNNLSSFKFGSMGNDTVLSTPSAELGPFEYPVNPDVVEKEEEGGEAHRRSSGSSSLLNDNSNEWRYNYGHGHGHTVQSGLGLPARGLAEEAVAAGSGIGRLRRMSTMNQVVSMQPEVRRPSVVHSNTDPLVDVVATASVEVEERQEEEGTDAGDREGVTEGDMAKGSLALHKRRATLENNGQDTSSPSLGPLTLPPGSISAAALGTVNLINARRQSILSFGQGAPVETPVPPRLAGLHVGTGSPARMQGGALVGKDELGSISALRRGSLPVNNMHGVDMLGASARSRQQSLGISSVGASSSAFARASFSSFAGPIVSNPGTRYEQTTVSTPYLYNRRNSLAHHYSLGGAGPSTQGAGQAQHVRPGLPPWQPRRMSTSEASDAGRSVGGSSSTSSMRTVRADRLGSDVSTPMGLGEDKDVGYELSPGAVDEGLRRSMETFSFGTGGGTIHPPARSESPTDLDPMSSGDGGPVEAIGPSASYSFGRTSISSLSRSSSITSNEQARSRPGSISAVRAGLRSGRNESIGTGSGSGSGAGSRTSSRSGHREQEGQGTTGGSRRSSGTPDQDGMRSLESQGRLSGGLTSIRAGFQTMRDHDGHIRARTSSSSAGEDAEPPGQRLPPDSELDGQADARARMISAGSTSSSGSGGGGYDSQVICSSSSSASSTSSSSGGSIDGSGSRPTYGIRGTQGAGFGLDRFGRRRSRGRFGSASASASASAPRSGERAGLPCPVPEIPPFRGGLAMSPSTAESTITRSGGGWTSGSSGPSTPSVEDDYDYKHDPRQIDEEDEDVDALTPMTELDKGDVQVVLGPALPIDANLETGGKKEEGAQSLQDDGLYVVYEGE
ncbi:hypothetical protein FFLO_04742 [Filobasidium floriforme]|uniref:Uncharacterized protein n=1 Tax=Filobasidium floriforme TaxID=5210 RepID=A0A8K0NNY3_9TREE|nr:hypothetical protein FFLO_04742 [Filobasidium floriforme]